MGSGASLSVLKHDELTREKNNESFKQNLIAKTEAETFFLPFRSRIVGVNATHKSMFDKEIPLLYVDWTSSGRRFSTIEEKLKTFKDTLSAETAEHTSAMKRACQISTDILKKHVKAADDDILASCASEITSAINILQKVLELEVPVEGESVFQNSETNVPVVLVTHFENYDQIIAWECTSAIVEIVPPDIFGQISVENFEEALKRHTFRRKKIACVSAYSNVTGIGCPFHEISKIMHRHAGICFVDFSCAFPYISIDMHPDTESSLDAIFLCPHKMLGGLGSGGILIFNQNIMFFPRGAESPLLPYDSKDPSLEDSFVSQNGTNENERCLRVIQGALAVQLKEEMGIQNIISRQNEIMELVFSSLSTSKSIAILGGYCRNKVLIFSVILKNVHYDLCVALLHDKFGIQACGGCCAGSGSYGYYESLVGLSAHHSFNISEKLDEGDLAKKLGWVRLSFHPTHSSEEVVYVFESLKEISRDHEKLKEHYTYNPVCNQYIENKLEKSVDKWFGQNNKKSHFRSKATFISRRRSSTRLMDVQAAEGFDDVLPF